MAKDNKKKVEQITDMEVDFAQWYTDVCRKAELIDYSSIKGMFIYRCLLYTSPRPDHRQGGGPSPAVLTPNAAQPALAAFLLPRPDPTACQFRLDTRVLYGRMRWFWIFPLPILSEKERDTMRKTYDTMILGCGEAGVFAGYELIRRNPGMKVLIVDQGQDIYLSLIHI